MICTPACEYTDDLAEAKAEWTSFIQLDYMRMDLQGPTNTDTVYVRNETAALLLLVRWNKLGFGRFVYAPVDVRTLGATTT